MSARVSRMCEAFCALRIYYSSELAVMAVTSYAFKNARTEKREAVSF